MTKDMTNTRILLDNSAYICAICRDAGNLVDGIINCKGTGPCPFEAAVINIADAAEALTAIHSQMAQMQKGQ